MSLGASKGEGHELSLQTVQNLVKIIPKDGKGILMKQFDNGTILLMHNSDNKSEETGTG